MSACEALAGQCGQCLTFGGRGTIQPSSKALSMMVASIVLMVTGSWLMPSTHAPWTQENNQHHLLSQVQAS